MSTTYIAILHGDRVEWLGAAPETNGGVKVEITVLGAEELDKATRGKAMSDALTKLAESGGIPQISDPVAWQREIRRDRSLPERED